MRVHDSVRFVKQLSQNVSYRRIGGDNTAVRATGRFHFDRQAEHFGDVIL